MSKHTKGPWSAEFPDEIYVRAEDGTRIAILGNLRGRLGMGGRIPTSEVESNARLIAASPDLLSELRMAHQIIRNALTMMTPEQKGDWMRANARDGVIGEGTTRANEREAVINRAEGREGAK